MELDCMFLILPLIHSTFDQNLLIEVDQHMPEVATIID